MRGDYICMLLAGSDTNARRAVEALTRAGVSARLSRIPRELALGGCGKAVAFDGNRLNDALGALRTSGLPRFPVYCSFGGGRFEPRART